MANPIVTVAHTAESLRQVRASASERDVNLFLCAVERHYGTDHMKAAQKLAGEIAQAKHEAEHAVELLAAHAAAWWRDIDAPDYVAQVNATFNAYEAAGGTDEHYVAHWRALSDAAREDAARVVVD